MAGIVFFQELPTFLQFNDDRTSIIGFLASPVYILTTFIGSKFYNSRGKEFSKG